MEEGERVGELGVRWRRQVYTRFHWTKAPRGALRQELWYTYEYGRLGGYKGRRNVCNVSAPMVEKEKHNLFLCHRAISQGATVNVPANYDYSTSSSARIQRDCRRSLSPSSNHDNWRRPLAAVALQAWMIRQSLERALPLSPNISGAGLTTECGARCIAVAVCPSKNASYVSYDSSDRS